MNDKANTPISDEDLAKATGGEGIVRGIIHSICPSCGHDGAKMVLEPGTGLVKLQCLGCGHHYDKTNT